MTIQKHASVHCKDVSLEYEVRHDRTSSLKEWIINSVHRRKFTDKNKTVHRALDSFSIDIKEGDRLGVIGLNGAGKSTLLKVISGILQPTTGSVEVHGAVQPLIELGAGFNPEFSGKENIYLNGYMLGFTKAEIQEKEAEIISFSELKDFINVPVKYYSSGMTVRLAFTIATSIHPEILLVDEMLSAGDASFIEKAKKRMLSLLDKAKIIVVVSHDLNLIKELSTHTLVLRSGRIAYSGSSSECADYYLKEVVPNGR